MKEKARAALDPDLLRFVQNLAIANARRDHLIETSGLREPVPVQPISGSAIAKIIAKNGNGAGVKMAKSKERRDG